jgi:hypothetical protein
VDLLITVLTLLAAVLAVTPRERQLDIRVRVRKFDWFVVAVSIVLVLALEFYEFLQLHCSWLPPKESWWKGITPGNATYLVVLCAAVIVGIRLRRAKLTPGKMLTFRDLVEELYWNGSYSELFALLQTHLKSLFRIYSADYFLPRLRAKLDPTASFHASLSVVNDLRAATGIPVLARSAPPFLRRAFSGIVSDAKYWGWRLIRMFPANDAAQLSAREIVRGIFLSPKFLTALALTRPYLGLDIIKLSKNSFERSDFVDLFVKELLRDPHSVLFREIEDNQTSWGERYEILPSNQFLRFFLSDVNVAKELGIYKPVGDFVIGNLAIALVPLHPILRHHGQGSTLSKHVLAYVAVLHAADLRTRGSKLPARRSARGRKLRVPDALRLRPLSDVFQSARLDSRHSRYSPGPDQRCPEIDLARV